MYTIEVYKVRVEYGCGVQDKDNKMVTTFISASFGMNTKHWSEKEGQISSKDPPRSEVVTTEEEDE